MNCAERANRAMQCRPPCLPLSDGAVFGEVGLFAPQHRRALTAACDDECRLSTITRDRVLELYYQNPKFGFS
jgi:CRP-like cAMP-binding protein